MTPSLPSDQNIFFFSFGHRHGRGINVYFIRFCLVVVAHSGEKSPNDVGPSEEVDLQPYHHKMFFYLYTTMKTLLLSTKFDNLLRFLWNNLPSKQVLIF